MLPEPGQPGDRLPERQVNLHLSDLREVFHAVDRLAGSQLGDREICAKILDELPLYGPRFLRWLVRHTLHPEAEDDIMPDEVEEEDERPAGEYENLEIRFSRIPATVTLYALVQYRQQFWHVVEIDGTARRALLKPLNACPD
jgi:hypothetical protein